MEAKMQFLFTLFLSLLVSFAYASNILFNPLDGEGSHYFVAKVVAKELIKRGHTVTILVDDRFTDKVKADGNLDGFNVEIFKSNFTVMEYTELLQNITNAGLRGEYIDFMMELMGTDFIQRQVFECDGLLGNEKLIAKLQKANFDVAIQDPTLTCPLVQYLKKPFVMLAPAMGSSCILSLENRVPFYPSYMPEFATALDHKMSFQQRLKNTAYVLFFGFVVKAFANPHRFIREKYNLQDSSLLYADAEMWLVNGHFALDFPKPLLPNTVMVGGLTTRPAKPLSSVSILVYFSSNIKE